MTDQFRAQCAELADTVDTLLRESRSNLRPGLPEDCEERVSRARTLLAQTELPHGYIDPGHSDADRELLEAFYLAARSEGGTADEIHLRGIQAAIALALSRAPVQAADGEVGEPAAWICPAEPYWDGREWQPQWQTTTDQKLAEYWARPGKPTPLFARAPVQPADGEVAELVADLQRFIIEYGKMRGLHPELIYSIQEGIEGQESHLTISQLTRAADLLQHHQPPQPVAVGERLPGPEDWDACGRCWWFCVECPGQHPHWILAKEAYCDVTHWLPAHALPTPHHPTGGAMTLSPAAQAVLDAAHEAWITKDDAPSIAAAALRAAVEQTFPDERDTETELIRSDQLAIANELDPQP
jgi:hypothetical protein